MRNKLSEVFVIVIVSALALVPAAYAWKIFSGAVELEEWSYFIHSSHTVLFVSEFAVIGGLTFYVVRRAKDRKRKVLAGFCGISLMLLLGVGVTESLPFQHLAG